jgi:hypothetical protein
MLLLNYLYDKNNGKTDLFNIVVWIQVRTVVILQRGQKVRGRAAPGKEPVMGNVSKRKENNELSL